MRVQLVDYFHFDCPNLFTPLFELVLDLFLNLLLTLLEHVVVSIIVGILVPLYALQMHSLIHFHQYLNFE